MTKIIPHLTCRNAFDAIEFYGRAFGAKTLGTMPGPDGKLMHGALEIDGAHLYLVEEFPDFGGKSPQMLGGTPVTVHMQVVDADAVWVKAVDAGCAIAMPLELQFWGDKFGLLVDPFGHNWSIGQPVEEKTPEQIVASMAEMGYSESQCGPGESVGANQA